ncbi:hypothetical protein C8T65DRAFT_648580 [Cerioporus squamosus]|nr:hypothetical protein C8T65DRAFT_648580 [Cerioporus squamosus]
MQPESSSSRTPAAGPPDPPQFHSSMLVKREEEDPTSPNYVGIIRHRDHDRYNFRDVPNVKKELDDAKAADLDYERNIDILKRHIIALRRECDMLTQERDAARRVSATYQPGRGDVAGLVALRRECERLARERDAALDKSLASQNETALLRPILRRYKAMNGDTEAVIQSYKAEKDEIEAHVKQYNPEIIERQEELLVSPGPPQGIHALPPNPSPSFDTSVPMLRMRQGLTNLGVRRGPTSHVLDGSQRLGQFRQWLQSRPLLSSAQKGAPTNASAVFKTANLPVLAMPASRACKAPPLFLGQLYRWITHSKQLGLVICPDYTYVPSATYAQRIWSRADQWHACGEQEREVFYHHAGEVHYAGTYVCHTGPGRLKVQDISRVGMGTEEMVTRLESVTATGGKVPQEERNAVLALYREGSLTVNVLGLERVGFNDTLYSYLHVAYELQREAARVAKAEAKAQRKAEAKAQKTANKQSKMTKAQKKAARAAAQAAQMPQVAMPLPVPVLPAPTLPHTFGFNPPTFLPHPMYGGGLPPPQTSLDGAGAGNFFAPPPYPAPVRIPSPPRRPPSELEYTDDEYVDNGNPLKREREDDEYLLDDEREYKAAKLEDHADSEDEQRVDDKLRVYTEDPEDRHGYAWNGGWTEESELAYFEPYPGFKDKED